MRIFLIPREGNEVKYIVIYIVILLPHKVDEAISKSAPCLQAIPMKVKPRICE